MKVYECIAKVQRELAKEGIGKVRDNSAQGFKFRGIDDVYNAIATIMPEAGLCILPRLVARTAIEQKTSSGKTVMNVVLEAEYDFVAVEDGSKHTVKTWGEAMDLADKATNKAMSAAHKYALLQTFCIPTEGDNDADAHTLDAAGVMVEPWAQKMEACKTVDALSKVYKDGVQECRSNREAVVLLAKIKDGYKAALTKPKKEAADGAAKAV